MGDIGFAFQNHGCGWVWLGVSAGKFAHRIWCSSVYDPFDAMLQWIERVASGERDTSVLIDEEGSHTRLTLDWRLDGRYEFCVTKEYWRGHYNSPKRECERLYDSFVDPYATVDAFYLAFRDPAWKGAGHDVEERPGPVRDYLNGSPPEGDPLAPIALSDLVRLPRTALDYIIRLLGNCSWPEPVREIVTSSGTRIPGNVATWFPGSPRCVPPEYDAWSTDERSAFIGQLLDEPLGWPGPAERRMRFLIVEEWLRDRPL